MTGRWIRAAADGEIPLGAAKVVRVEAGWDLALFNVAGKYVAIDDTCPHQGASLGEGTLHEDRVICPWHGWVFDTRSGECVRVPGMGVRTYPTRLNEGAVEVEIPDASGTE